MNAAIDKFKQTVQGMAERGEIQLESADYAGDGWELAFASNLGSIEPMRSPATPTPCV